MKLNIIYTSDVHGQLTSAHYPSKTHKAMGLVRLNALLDTLSEPTLLLDNGDFLQGSVLLDYHRLFASKTPHPWVLAHRHLPYAAMTLGNHDFNYGQTFLTRVLEDIKTPVVCANLKRPDGSHVFAPYLIHTIQNITVGIVGAITQYVPIWEKPEHIEGLVFEDAKTCVQEAVNQLKGSVDFIVVLYHGGYEKDLVTGELIGRDTPENQGYQIAHLEGVDVLLCGHQHLPTVHTLPSGLLTLQTPANATHVGHVLIEKDGERWRKTGRLIPLDTPEDPAFLAALTPLEEATQRWLDTPVAKGLPGWGMSDPFLTRKDNHPLFGWIHQLQLNHTQAEISIASLPNEAPGFSQTIHLRDIAANFVYPNTLVVLEIEGRALLEGIKQSLRYFHPHEGTLSLNPAFIYPKVEHYNYDSFYPLDIEATYTQGGLDSLRVFYQGSPLALDRSYRVVLNNYRAAGGGDYVMYAEATLVREYDQSLFDLAVKTLQQDGQLVVPKANKLTLTLK